MNKQSGFTLIELVVVIIILGILSSMAIPRFLNLHSDARASALNGVRTTLEGAASAVYSKAELDGIIEANAAQTQEGVDTHFGYPTATQNGLGAVVDLDPNNWNVIFSGSTARYHAAETRAENINGCSVLYAESLGIRMRPEITIFTEDC